MDHKDAKKKMLAAYDILSEPSLTPEKFKSVRQLLYGVNPRLDELLHRLDARTHELEKLYGGNFVSLALESLPDSTEEERRRKKLLVTFWHSWNQLKDEVARVQEELDQAKKSKDSTNRAFHLAKIGSAARGAGILTTIIAVGIALAIQATSAEIVIVNQGCDTLYPSSSSLLVPLPGLSFPKDPIQEGGTGIATVPAFTYTIDGTQSGKITAAALSFKLSFETEGVKDVLLDGDSLIGKTAILKTTKSKNHTLAFICGK